MLTVVQTSSNLYTNFRRQLNFTHRENLSKPQFCQSRSLQVHHQALFL